MGMPGPDELGRWPEKEPPPLAFKNPPDVSREDPLGGEELEEAEPVEESEVEEAELVVDEEEEVENAELLDAAAAEELSNSEFPDSGEFDRVRSDCRSILVPDDNSLSEEVPLEDRSDFDLALDDSEFADDEEHREEDAFLPDDSDFDLQPADSSRMLWADPSAGERSEVGLITCYEIHRIVRSIHSLHEKIFRLQEEVSSLVRRLEEKDALGKPPADDHESQKG